MHAIVTRAWKAAVILTVNTFAARVARDSCLEALAVLLATFRSFTVADMFERLRLEHWRWFLPRCSAIPLLGVWMKHEPSVAIGKEAVNGFKPSCCDGD